MGPGLVHEDDAHGHLLEHDEEPVRVVSVRVRRQYEVDVVSTVVFPDVIDEFLARLFVPPVDDAHDVATRMPGMKISESKRNGIAALRLLPNTQEINLESHLLFL